ncbi:hypothetical protein PV326_010444 [Microctonus aethiopoides]|nr:hypothetical protein PV326_010444 [Microctonus aethiopoides]
MDGRGSRRAKVVHSPPRKCNGANWTGEGKSVQGEEGTVGKGENKRNEDNQNEREDKEAKREEKSEEQNKREGEEEKGVERGDKDEEENKEDETEREEENKEDEEREGGKKKQEVKEAQGEKEKARPNINDIEKMLMKERIKVLENEIIRVKVSDIQRRIEETIRKMRKEKEAEKEKWRAEKKELVEKVRKCEKEIEDKIWEINKEKGKEKEKKRSEAIEGGSEEESRVEREQGKSYSRIGSEQYKHKGKSEGRVREEQDNIEEERENPKGVTDEFMKYEMRERRERRKGMIITRNGGMERGEGKGDMIQEVRRRLGIEKERIRIKYEGENKANIEFKQMEDKLEALRNKKELIGTNIWIGDDHTRREISIQKWIRETARRERMKGKNAKVGYQKIMVENRVWKFNERSGQLEEMKFRDAEGTRSRHQKRTSGRGSY